MLMSHLYLSIKIKPLAGFRVAPQPSLGLHHTHRERFEAHTVSLENNGASHKKLCVFPEGPYGTNVNHYLLQPLLP